MNKKFMVILSVLVCILLLSLAKDLVIKVSVQRGTQLVTGLRLSISSFKVGLVNTLVGIKNLRLYNPRGFADKIMLEMPEIYVDYDLPAIFKGQVHLEEARINLKQFTVVKNEKGELNLDSLKVVQAQKEGRPPEEKTKGKAPKISIDDLKLRIGKVIYKDYSQGLAPVVREFDININERYQNITDAYSLVSLLVVRAMMNTTIANLVDFDLQGLKGTVSGTLASAEKIAAQAAEKAQQALKQTQKQAEQALDKTQEKAAQAAQEAQEALQKTSEELKGLTDKIKLPFGDN